MDKEYCASCFVGPRYQRIRKNRFSIPAFLLGPIYLAYRKMILYAILYIFLIILIDIIATLTNIPLILLSVVIFNVLLGFFASNLYLSFVDGKVEKIISSNTRSLEDDCKSKGGTSIICAILICFLQSALIAAVVFLLSFQMLTNVFNNPSSITELPVNTPALIVGDNKATSYTKKVPYEDGVNISDIISFSMPNYAIDLDEADTSTVNTGIHNKKTFYIPREELFDITKVNTSKELDYIEITIGAISIGVDEKTYANSHYKKLDKENFILETQTTKDKNYEWNVIESSTSDEIYAYGNINNHTIYITMKKSESALIVPAYFNKLFSQLISTITTDPSFEYSEGWIDKGLIFTLPEEEPEELPQVIELDSGTEDEPEPETPPEPAPAPEPTPATENDLNRFSLIDDLLVENQRISPNDYVNINVDETILTKVDTNSKITYTYAQDPSCTFIITVLKKYTKLSSLLEEVRQVGGNFGLSNTPVNYLDWNVFSTIKDDGSDSGTMYIWAEVRDIIIQVKTSYPPGSIQGIYPESYTTSLNLLLNGITAK